MLAPVGPCNVNSTPDHSPVAHTPLDVVNDPVDGFCAARLPIAVICSTSLYRKLDSFEEDI